MSTSPRPDASPRQRPRFLLGWLLLTSPLWLAAWALALPCIVLSKLLSVCRLPAAIAGLPVVLVAPISPILAVSSAGLRALWAPRLHMDENGIVVRRWYTRHTLPWAGLASIDLDADRSGGRCTLRWHDGGRLRLGEFTDVSELLSAAQVRGVPIHENHAGE